MEENAVKESTSEFCDIKDTTLERVPTFLEGKPIKDYDANDGDVSFAIII